MSDINTLILSGSGYELAVAPEAETLKSEIITASAAITAIINPDDNASAREQVKKLAALRNLCEKSRKQVKEPVIKIGKEIDAKATSFVNDIEAEEKRLSKLMGDYAAKVEAERVKVMRELEARERAVREAEAARIKAAQEAEAARIAAEKAEWEAITPDQAAAAAAALKQAEEMEAKRVADEAAEAARKEAESKIVAFVPEKASGVKFTADFEVTDLDALYRYSPALVSMEAKRKDILDLIKAIGADEDKQIIPGIKITSKAVVSTR